MDGTPNYASYAEAKAACEQNSECEVVYENYFGTIFQQRKSCKCLSSPPSWCVDVPCGTPPGGDNCNTGQGGKTSFKPASSTRVNTEA